MSTRCTHINGSPARANNCQESCEPAMLGVQNCCDGKPKSMGTFRIQPLHSPPSKQLQRTTFAQDQNAFEFRKPSRCQDVKMVGAVRVIRIRFPKSNVQCSCGPPRFPNHGGYPGLTRKELQEVIRLHRYAATRNNQYFFVTVPCFVSLCLTSLSQGFHIGRPQEQEDEAGQCLNAMQINRGPASLGKKEETHHKPLCSIRLMKVAFGALKQCNLHTMSRRVRGPVIAISFC